LEVDRNATDTEIKKSYKALALKYHPDRNRNKSEAEQEETSRKFKEAAEAYGCLSDPKKKQMYDSGQIDYDGDQGAGFGGMGGNIDPTEIFQMFFGGGGMGGGMGGMGGMGGRGGMGGFGGGGGSQSYSFRFG
jgi:DnaJ family protein C protein 7